MNIFNFIFNTINGDYMNLVDIMSKKIIVGNKDDNIVKIADIMKKYDIGFIPIVDNKKIIGVITDRDITTKAVSNNDINNHISNYMTKNIISISSNSSISDALNTMKKNKIKRILISDNKKIIGVISISDILNCNINDQLLNSIKEIWEISPNIHKYETEIDEFYL